MFWTDHRRWAAPAHSSDSCSTKLSQSDKVRNKLDSYQQAKPRCSRSITSILSQMRCWARQKAVCSQLKSTSSKTMQRRRTQLGTCTKLQHFQLVCHPEEACQCREKDSVVRLTCLRTISSIMEWVISLWTIMKVWEVTLVVSIESMPTDSHKRRNLYPLGAQILINSVPLCRKPR